MTPDEIRGLLARVRAELQEEMRLISSTLQSQIETIDSRTREWYNQLNRTFKLLLDLDTEDYKARLKREAEETLERNERRKELDRELRLIRWISISSALFLIILTLLGLGVVLAGAFR